MRHQLDEYLAAGMDNVVAKPIQLHELFAALQALTEPQDTDAKIKTA